MSVKRMLLLVCLFAAVLPLAAHERQVLLVLVDLEAGRAYVPEGSVIPAGMNVRAGKENVDRATFERARASVKGGQADARERNARRAVKARLHAKPPLVFEYAPAERFVEARKGYEAQAAKRPRVQSDSHQTCFDTYVSDTKPGYYSSGYTNGFTSTFCQPSTGLLLNQVNNWEFRATADYSDDDQWIYPNVWIDDQNGNFFCYDEIQFSGDLGQCSAAASTVLTSSGCKNDVDTMGTEYYIEYLNNYVEN